MALRSSAAKMHGQRYGQESFSAPLASRSPQRPAEVRSRGAVGCSPTRVLRKRALHITSEKREKITCQMHLHMQGQ